MEKVKTYSKSQGNRFLAHIRTEGNKCAQWNYKDGCFLMWVNGILSKLEHEKQFVYISEKGWVAI